MDGNNTQLERLISLAEDELAVYSTDARKIERLRRKIGLSVTPTQQKEVKQELLELMPQGFLGKLVEEQRQTVALPFWGIAGLGLLFGISLRQPVDFLAPAIGIPLAVNIQKWGWSLQAKRILLKTLEEIEARMKQPTQD
ncbi:MAG: hypothetical protein AAGA16_14740 [Cyanobacteria bacterium P01_E01_bin.35]